MLILQLLFIIGLMLVHLYASQLRYFAGIPRSRWLSLAGGISIGYVFLHIFPELHQAQHTLSDELGILPYIENHAYLVAMIGLTFFYGLERFVKINKRRRTPTIENVFFLHIASFSAYNGLIGYLLVHREDSSLHGLLIYFIAMGLHFVVNDYGLREHHQVAYEKKGRWVLAIAILAGWLIGLITTVSEATLGILFAFLAGGVMLNVLKEELPEERQSRFIPFAIGVVISAALFNYA